MKVFGSSLKIFATPEAGAVHHDRIIYGPHKRARRSNMNILQGKKTYATAAVMVALAVAEYAGIEVPASVWILLNGLGLGFLRQAISR